MPRLAAVASRSSSPANAGAAGRLFGAVTTADIADAVKASGGPQIDKRKVEIGQPIKALGEYPVSVRLHAEASRDDRPSRSSPPDAEHHQQRPVPRGSGALLCLGAGR